jgi:MFS family permease
MRPWGAFLFRDYRFLWATMITATMVVWLRILSTAQWLLDETGSAVLVGFIGVVQLVVQIPALLWGGALADRIDRKRLMALANGTTCLAMLSLGVLDVAGLLSPVMVYVGIALTAASQMLANPARSAMVPIAVPKQHLMLAASTDTASQNAAAIAGPLLFAGVAVTAGVTAAFFTAAAVSLLSALLPLGIRVPGVAEGHAEDAPTSAVHQTLEGFRYVVKHPILPGLFLLDTGITVASFYREILPVLALGLFAGGASATGLLGAANSAGAIAGSFVALLFVAYRAKGMLVLYASLAYGVILFGFGTASTLWMGLLMIALLGAADAVTVAVRQTTVMLTTPDHMRGRAFALLILAAQTANNIGTIWVGAWAGAIGAGNTMVLAGFVSIGATLLIWRFWRPIREFRSD